MHVNRNNLSNAELRRKAIIVFEDEECKWVIRDRERRWVNQLSREVRCARGLLNRCSSHALM